jgi:hypothetical protein
MWPLKNLISKIPVWESRISFGDWIWRAACALVTLLVSSGATFVAWLDGVVQAWGLGRLGYAMVFLSVAFAVSLILLIVARATDYFRGRPPRGGKEDTGAEKEKFDPRGLQPPEEVSTGGLSEGVCRDLESFERRLYLGQVIFSCERAHEHLLRICMACFNGSAEEIEVVSVRGHIKAEEIDDDGVPVKVGSLETPQIDGYKTAMHIKPFSEFNISLWQHIPKEVADRLVADVDIEFRFDFEELDIQLCKASDSSAKAKLRLWDGARLVKLADHSCTHRSVIIRLMMGSVNVG